MRTVVAVVLISIVSTAGALTVGRLAAESGEAASPIRLSSPEHLWKGKKPRWWQQRAVANRRKLNAANRTIHRQAVAVKRLSRMRAPSGKRTLTMTATAYCLTGSTATGTSAGPGAIAVDPSVIPLGTRLHVSGYGHGVASDTGGAIHGYIIDVWLPCARTAAWGRRTVTVTVL